MADITTRDSIYIGGEWVRSTGSGVIEVVSPNTGELIGTAPDVTTEDIDAAVAAARRAMDEGPWPTMPKEERLAAIGRLSAILLERGQEIADTISKMSEDGIHLEVCLAAVEYFGVEPASIQSEIKQVGNGWISEIGYQAKGYTLVPVY